MKTHPNSHTWFNAHAIAPGRAEVVIYDEIGYFGVTAKDFDNSLKALGKVSNLDLRINSPGGDVFAGNAIHNMLERMKASGTHITVYIDGVAASMASLIAMVGDQVVMPANAMMMIHNPTGGVLGDADDMRAWGDVLDRLTTGMAATYAKKSGQTVARVMAMMDAETWMTAQEAVDLGFADIIEEPAAIAARFDLRHYAHPPESYGDSPAPAGAAPGEAFNAMAREIYGRQHQPPARPAPAGRPFIAKGNSLEEQSADFAARQRAIHDEQAAAKPGGAK